MIFQNSSKAKAKTAQNVILRACLPVGTAKSRSAFFRILKISAIFLTIIILFFGTAHQSFADAKDAVIEGAKTALGVGSLANISSIGEGIKSALLDGVSIIIGFVFYLLGVISGTILTIGGYLMDLGLALNRGVIDNE